MLVPAILIALAAIAVVVGLLLGRLELGGPLGVRPRGDASPSPGAPAAEELAVAAVADHDPPPGDGQEHPEEASQAVDGDAGTVWRTEHYTSPDLGGIKGGVGLIFDLGGPRDVRQVTLETPLPGWTFQVHGADDAGAFADPAVLGAPFVDEDGGTSFVAETTTVRRFPEATARYVLVWITELASVEGDYRAVIAEATFAGA
jgi:putative peptidoglycan lipid II flippase